MATVYMQIFDRDTWHWRRDCSHVIRRKRGMTVRDTKPKSGEKCNECLAKDRADRQRISR